MKTYFRYLLGMMLLVVMCVKTMAAEPPPVVMLKQVSANIIAELKKTEHKKQGELAYIEQIADRYVIPHMDTVGMAREGVVHCLA